MVVFVALAVMGLAHQQEIRDSIAGWAYTPSDAVSKIVSDTGLTDEGRRVFYATHPGVVAAEAFNKACPRSEPQSPVVGCYAPDDSIYIYNVTNPKLSGIEQVTATHELLHAVWARMDSRERAHLSALVLKSYEKHADADLKERMAYYERTEKGQEANELFAILGTEVRGLPQELEQRYERYFDRGAVVRSYEKYQSQYKELEARVEALSAQIDAREGEITRESAAYTTSANNLQGQIERFNARANGGYFTTQTQFYAQRAQLMSEVSSLEARRAAINQKIEEYNALISERNDVSSEIQSLNNSMDSMKSLDEPSSITQL